MASCSIPSWQIDGDTMERVTDFIFFGSKITADGDCIHEIKSGLLLGRKAMTMKLKVAYSLGEKLWPTYTACWKTLLYRQRSV